MRRSVVVVLVVLGWLGVACSSSPPPLTAEDEVFAGLDPAVVAEVLADPIARQRIEEEPPATRESLAQGIVRNFTVCRDAYRVYDAWRTTGTMPALAPLPMPEHARQPSHRDWARSYAHLADVAEPDRAGQLRTWLTGEGSCGRWIPLEPGDGFTIAEAVEAGE